MSYLEFQEGKKILATVKEEALQSLLTVHLTWMKWPVLSQPQDCRGTFYLHAGLHGQQDEAFWEHWSELWALFWRMGSSSMSLCHLSHSVSPRHWAGTSGHHGTQMRHDKSELIHLDKLFPDFLSLPYKCSQQYQVLPAIQPEKADICLVSSQLIWAQQDTKAAVNHASPMGLGRWCFYGNR